MRNGRRIRLVATAALVAVTAACSPADSGVAVGDGVSMTDAASVSVPDVTFAEPPITQTPSTDPPTTEPALPAGTIVIATDLPMQQPPGLVSLESQRAIDLVVEMAGGLAGEHLVTTRHYDNSTAARGGWDDATCVANAREHLDRRDEVVVLGPYNSGCAKLMVPVLNSGDGGPMLLMSHANSNPGLIKPWDPGEPDRFYPNGERNYARMVSSDDWQGYGLSAFAATELGLNRCAVLTDGDTYGAGIAETFIESGELVGLETFGPLRWDFAEPSYVELFEQVAAEGVDCVVLSGIFDNNGGQLIRDKVAVLGSNAEVAVLAPDGFSGYPELWAMPDAEGMHISVATPAVEAMQDQADPAFMEVYAERYGEVPTSTYSYYAAATAQFLLQAIAESDGTRAGVLERVMSGEVVVSAEESVLGFELEIGADVAEPTVQRVMVQRVIDGSETAVFTWISDDETAAPAEPITQSEASAPVPEPGSPWNLAATVPHSYDDLPGPRRLVRAGGTFWLLGALYDASTEEQTDGYAMSSEDLAEWQPLDAVMEFSGVQLIRNLVDFNGRIVGVYQERPLTTAPIGWWISSTDGVDWDEGVLTNESMENFITTVVAIDGTLYATGGGIDGADNTGEALLWTSTDGVDWTFSDLDSTSLTGERFFAGVPVGFRDAVLIPGIKEIGEGDDAKRSAVVWIVNGESNRRIDLVDTETLQSVPQAVSAADGSVTVVSSLADGVSVFHRLDGLTPNDPALAELGDWLADTAVLADGRVALLMSFADADDNPTSSSVFVGSFGAEWTELVLPAGALAQDLLLVDNTLFVLSHGGLGEPIGIYQTDLS